MSADRGEVAAEQSLLEGKWGGGLPGSFCFLLGWTWMLLTGGCSEAGGGEGCRGLN